MPFTHILTGNLDHGHAGKTGNLQEEKFQDPNLGLQTGLLWSSLSKDAKSMVGIGPLIQEKNLPE